MSYSRWATEVEMKENLEKVNIKEEVKCSGIPLVYEDNNFYVNRSDIHNLIIGSTGSGKTQSVVLPLLKLSMMANESMIINDPLGELYKVNAKKLQDEGYKTIVIDLEDSRKGNNWNPLTLPYMLYKEGNKDKALDLIDDLGYYLFEDSNRNNSDPFWVNSVINYFTGITLYLFENAKEEEINLKSVESLTNQIHENKLSQEFLEKIDSNSLIYSKLVGTLKAPSETKGSILAVFRQKIEKYVAKENLTNMLSTTDFDITNIIKDKTAVFIISGMSTQGENLIPLFVNQIIDIVSLYGKKERNLVMLLDEFDDLLPIRNFAKKLTLCRYLGINVTVCIRSYIHLQNMYSKEEVEILKMCFGCIIYLLSSDIYTIEEISKYCGEVKENTPLISKEELQTLNTFEAVVIMTRMMPFKTKLIPDYKIDWGYENEEMDIPERKINNISIFKY